MFVFNSCSNNHGHDSISFSDHSFLQFPSPFDDDGATLLQQQQPQHDILLHHIPLNELVPAAAAPTFVSTLGSSETVNNAIVHQELIMEQQMSIQRKRASSKRDRHSKINTLHGPRDRRMRLSLPVAREFFGLQDLLGVDKASKTVEWLLFQARHAIKKLSRDQPSYHNRDLDGDTRSPSSASDGEVVSGIIDETTVNNYINTKELEGRKATKKEKKGRVARKMACHPLTRECREKARARARARTREKQLQIEGISTSRLQDVSKISSSWSTQIENNGEEQLRTRNEGIIIDHETDDCLMIMGRWSPSNSIYYNSLHNNNNGSPQEHPFGDFHFLGKPWEPYNNHSIC